MKRLGIISLFVLLFIGFISIWHFSYKLGLEEAVVPIMNEEPINLMPSEKGVFRRSEHAMDYANMPIDKNHQRSLVSYYKNRAFPGAPPTIPHALNNDRNMGGNACLKCHENGGFVSKFEAYAPVTPHPEMVNCRQCHVPENTSSVFKPSNFHKNEAPEAGVNNALIGSPPVIPHQLQMRENCLSCHGGASAPAEIRVSHPERINCRQCHVPNNKSEKDIGIFKRKSHEKK